MSSPQWVILFCLGGPGIGTQDLNMVGKCFINQAWIQPQTSMNGFRKNELACYLAYLGWMTQKVGFTDEETVWQYTVASNKLVGTELS